MNKKKVIIFGDSGHGKVIADIVSDSGDELLGFLDDDISKRTLGCIKDYVNFHDVEFVIGIGDKSTRERLSLLDCEWYTAIHPSAVISSSARVGHGSVVMPNAVINAGGIIGNHCIINTGAIVEHDDVVEDFAHISVGAKLGGAVRVGNGTWIGIGATVKNNLTICHDCVIGAGGVVISNINEPGIYIGVPARRMRK